MSSFKRKREDFEEDSDEEEPTYGRQILPVANLPEDFNEEPMDGMQYLFMVRRDARQLPGTVRVPNPYEKAEVLRSEEIPEEARHLPNHLQLPSLEWRELFEHRFQNFRTNFDQPTVNIGPVNAERNRLMPEKKDRDLWWAFLSGKPELEWNPSKRSKARLKKQQYLSQGMRGWANGPLQKNEVPPPSGSNPLNNDEGEVEEVLRVDPAETLPSPAGTPAPLDYTEAIAQSASLPTIIRTSEQVPVAREATTQLLKMIDERTALHLLMYFAHWINTYLKLPESDEYLPTCSHARWILSLLSRVDYFVSADDMNLLRNLARACLALLKNIKAKYISPGDAQPASNIMTEAFCWIIITTIADVWKQKDLWMEAKDVLKSL